MSTWKPDWEPGREIPLEQMKQVLDKYLPGFTKVCEKVAVDPHANVALDLSQFRPSHSDMALLGMAVVYSHRTNAAFVNLPQKGSRPTVNFLSVTPSGDVVETK